MCKDEIGTRPRYGVFEWPESFGLFRWTAATFRKGENTAPAKLVRECRTWQEAFRIANRFNLAAAEQDGTNA